MKPAFCPFIYRDQHHIYLEFTNHVQRFPFTDGGLFKALRHIPSILDQPGYLSGLRNITEDILEPGHVARKTKAKAKISPRTEAERRIARFSPKTRAALGSVIDAYGPPKGPKPKDAK